MKKNTKAHVKYFLKYSFMFFYLLSISILFSSQRTSAASGSWVLENGHSYQLYDISYDWHMAEAFCQQMGGHLITVTTPEEVEIVNTYIAMTSKKNLWLGGELSSNGINCTTGEPGWIMYNWYPTEPNGPLGGHIMIHTYQTDRPINDEENAPMAIGTLNDHDGMGGGHYGYGSFGFICEWDKEIEDPDIKLNDDNVVILKGDSKGLKYTINSKKEPKLTWSSDNTSLVKVDNKGNIQGLKAGKATITVKTEKGKSDSCTVYVFDINESSFDFGGNQSDTISGLPLSFNGYDFNLLSMDIGNSVSISNVKPRIDESNLKIKVLVGCSSKGTISGGLDFENIYDKAKSVTTSSSFGYNEKEGEKRIDDFIESLSLKPEKVKIGLDTEGYIIGYLEFDFSGGEPIFTEGSIIIKGSVNSYRQIRPMKQFPPFYVKLGIEAEVGGKLALSVQQASIGKPTISTNGEFQLAFSPYIGAGLDVILMDAELGSKITIEGAFTLPDLYSSRLEASGSVYLNWNVLCYTGGLSRTLWNYQIYPKSEENKGISSLAIDSFDISDMKQQERNTKRYMNDIQSYSIDGDSNVLKSNVYEYGDPVMVKLTNGDILLVYVDDDLSRKDVNRTALMYSICSNGKWSEPKQVYDDSTADFSPRIINSNGRVHLVWMNCNKRMDDKAELLDMAKEMDLYYAEFNGSSFVNITNITYEQDNVLEYSPVIMADGDQLEVIWAENSTNDIFQMKNTISIYRSIYTGGKFSSRQVVEQNLSYLSNLSGAYYAGEKCIVYTASNNNDINSSQVYIIRNGSKKQVTSSPGAKEELQILKDSLYWIENGNDLYSAKLNNLNKIYKMDVKLPVDAQDMKLVTADDQTMYLVYKTNSDYVNHLFSCKYDIQRGSWEPNRQETNGNQAIRDYDALVTKDGELIFAYMRSALKSVTKDGDMPFGRTDLIVSGSIAYVDIELTDFYYSGSSKYSIENGIPLNITITNKGNKTVQGIKLNYYNSKQQLIHTELLENELTRGAIIKHQYYYELPDDIAMADITLELELTEDIESVDANNVKTAILSNADIDVQCDVSDPTEAGYYVEAVVTNSGGKTAKNIIVTASSLGTVISSKTIKSIAPGKSNTIQLFVPYKNLTNTVLYYNSIVINATSTSEDSYYTDNTAEVVLMSRRVDGLKLSKKEITLSKGNSYPLNASVYPENAANKNISYSSSNTKVASVNKYGVVKAHKSGEAIITVTSVDGKFHQKCSIKVTGGNEKTKVKQVLILTDQAISGSITIKKGSSETLYVNITPTTAMTSFTWSSSNRSIASVSKDGLMKGLKKGSCTITVTAKNGVKASIKVVVK